MNPPPAPRGVGSNSKSPTTKLPMPYIKILWSVVPYRLHLGHAKSFNGCGSREQGRTVGTETCERRTGSEWFGSSTDAGVGFGFGGFVGDTGTASKFGSGWGCVLGDFVDGWSEASERVARHSVDVKVVFQLRQDRRVGELVGVGCRASLVHESEWSDRDSSCGEADRSDGCSEHGLDVFDGFHSERQSQVGVGRDSGCQ